MSEQRREPSTNELLARYIAREAVRGVLEDMHSGTGPKTEAGDFSDVKVVGADGQEIPWNSVSHISQSQMHELMLNMEKAIAWALDIRDVMGYANAHPESMPGYIPPQEAESILPDTTPPQE